MYGIDAKFSHHEAELNFLMLGIFHFFGVCVCVETDGFGCLLLWHLNEPLGQTHNVNSQILIKKKFNA